MIKLKNKKHIFNSQIKICIRNKREMTFKNRNSTFKKKEMFHHTRKTSLYFNNKIK